MDYQKLLRKFKETKSSIASFIAFDYQRKSDNEKSKRIVNIGVSYKNVLKKDIEYLKTLSVGNDELKEQARTELLQSVVLSYRKQLVFEKNRIKRTTGGNSSNKLSIINNKISEIDNNYIVPEKDKEKHENFSNGQLNAFIYLRTGLKYHKEKHKLYIIGFNVRKTVIEVGEIKADTRRELTKAKDEIRKNMKMSKLRLFDLSQGIISNISIKGDTIEINIK